MQLDDYGDGFVPEERKHRPQAVIPGAPLIVVLFVHVCNLITREIKRQICPMSDTVDDITGVHAA